MKKNIIKSSFVIFSLLISSSICFAVEQVSVYFANWNTLNSQSQSMTTLTKVDEILYAFAGINADGSISFTSPMNDLGITTTAKSISISDAAKAFSTTPGGNLEALSLLKDENPNVKIVLSIGGWGNGANFSQAFSSKGSRDLFISNVESLLANFKTPKGQNLFDGVDIDWEYPRMVIGISALGMVSGNDTANLQEAVIDLRNSLPEGAIISIALPHGVNDLDGGSINNFFRGVDGKLLETNDRFIRSVSTFNLMAYDFMAFAPFTTPNAPMGGKQSNIKDGLKALREDNVPNYKISIGAPAYGRCIGSTVAGQRGLVTSPNENNHGIGIQLPPITNATGTQWPCQIAWPLYSSINLKYINDKNIFYNSNELHQTIVYWDTLNNIPSKADKVSSSLSNFIDIFMSFDSPKNIFEKSKYIKDNGYGGIFFWEVNQDKPWGDSTVTISDRKYPASLIQTAVDVLKK